MLNSPKKFLNRFKLIKKVEEHILEAGKKANNSGKIILKLQILQKLFSSVSENSQGFWKLFEESEKISGARSKFSKHKKIFCSQSTFLRV